MQPAPSTKDSSLPRELWKMIALDSIEVYSVLIRTCSWMKIPAAKTTFIKLKALSRSICFECLSANILGWQLADGVDCILILMMPPCHL